MLLFFGQRGQTLHLLDIKNRFVSRSRVCFRIWDLLKTSRPGDHFSELTFEAYVQNRRLCLCITITSHLSRTSTNRATRTSFFFFLISKAALNVASRDTLQRWTKESLQVVGIDINMFSQHSARSTASSKRALRLPLSTIISTVGWSNESIFAKFYRKPVLLTYC